jgi:hypothetical protein
VKEGRIESERNDDRQEKWMDNQYGRNREGGRGSKGRKKVNRFTLQGHALEFKINVSK